MVFTGGVQWGAGVYPRRAELTTTAAGVPPLRKSYAALRISQWTPCASEAYQPRLSVRVRTKVCVSPFARAQVLLTQPSQLARVHTLITMAGLFSPPLRKSVRLPPSSPPLRYAQPFGVDFARLNMRLLNGAATGRSRIRGPMRVQTMCDHRLLGVLEPMVPDDFLHQPWHFTLIAWHNGRHSGSAVRTITVNACDCARRLAARVNGRLVCSVRNRTLQATCLKDPLETVP